MDLCRGVEGFRRPCFHDPAPHAYKLCIYRSESQLRIHLLSTALYRTMGLCHVIAFGRCRRRTRCSAHAGEPSVIHVCAIVLTFSMWMVASVAIAQEARRTWQELNDDVVRLYRAGEYQRALPVARQALEVAEEIHGSDHPDVATSLNWLAETYRKQSQYAQAEPLYRRGLRIREEQLGSQHPDVAISLNDLAWLYLEQNRTAQAAPLAERALTIRERVLGPNHPDLAVSLNTLAVLHYYRNEFAQAEPLYQRALTIREQALGREHSEVATSLNNLASLYTDMGAYAKADTLYERALAIREKALGADHPDVARTLNSLGKLSEMQGRYSRADTLLQRALGIRENALGPDHRDVADSLNELAVLRFRQGRYAEAEPLALRAIAIWEKVLGPAHPFVAAVLSNLAFLYRAMDRQAQAEPIYLRTMVIWETAGGPDSPDVANSLHNLARLYSDQGRYDEAEQLAKRAVAIWEKALGPDHRNVATGLNNLALVYRRQGRYPDAASLYQRALTIDEKALGTDHPSTATSLSDLAELYSDQARFMQAEPLARRALTIREAILGPTHPSVALSLTHLAIMDERQGRLDDAVLEARRATQIRRARFSSSSGPANDRGAAGTHNELRSNRFGFVTHVGLLAALAARSPSQNRTLAAEGFEVAQLARASGTGAVVAQMAARFSSGTSELAVLVRRRQDTVNRLRFLDRQQLQVLGTSASSRDPASEARLREEINAAESELAATDAALTGHFPDFQVLTDREPIQLGKVQQLLGPQEALLSYLVAADESYLWVVRSTRFTLIRLGIGSKELDERVTALRRALDTSQTQGELVPFPAKTAHELYRVVFSPAESELEGISHVMVVPDGALQSLPLTVLIARPPREGAGNRDMEWLARRFAFSTLPSEPSLPALRRLAVSHQAPDPFVGFGDPAFSGPVGVAGNNGMMPVTLRVLADVKQVRQLTPLPDSASEINGMASVLGANKQAVFLGMAATETQVKRLDLTRYRAVAFATHGLIAGEMEGIAEPALALTPPPTATEEDDGLLTAGEIAQLKLNAEWVILSACNTAAADGTPGAERLSGLAKAFLYAGSRTLLVSHWPVDSRAAAQLTSRMMIAAGKQPGLPKAEALRRAMLEVMGRPGTDFSHPVFWAPFVIVGEGGATIGTRQ